MTAGLVASSTSVTRAPRNTSPGRQARVIELDPIEGRGRRLKRAVKWAANIHSTPAPGRRAPRCAMVTLTYAAVDGWGPKHITQFLQAVRAWLKRRGHALRYTWVAELQKRGAVHYHVLVWLPKGLTMPKPDKQGWWRHGSTKVEWARKPVGYICKYASKFDGVAEFPKGIRLHGAGGFAKGTERDVRHWLSLPGWLRQQVGVGQRMRRVPGVGLVLADTGEVVPSPWRFGFSNGQGFARELFAYAHPVPATGPYSLLRDPSFQRIEVVH